MLTATPLPSPPLQERKKALKEEAREKRKNKMPKSEKARLIKKSSGRS